MSITVTAAQSGSYKANGTALTVKVLTGAAVTQNGATTQSTTVTVPELAITPTGNGSFVYGAVTADGAFSYTPAANTTFSQNVTDSTNAGTYGTFRGTSVTSSGTPVTLGGTGPTKTSGTYFIALAEILAAGTLAEDASSPAPVSTTTAETVTTAAFTPPAGSLLVATVSMDTTGGGADTIAMSTSGMALTWTQLVADSRFGIAAVLIARVPGAPSVATGSLPGGTVGTAYSQTVSASGGTSPYTWSIASGSLPGGLSIGSSSGTISGTPTTAGTSSFVVQVTDANGYTGTASLSITITAAGGSTFDSAPASPTFPAQFLDERTEIQLNGVWTDISGYVYQDSTTSGRGHPDESTTASPSSLSATLNNADGRFSQLNPNGPYYPYLGLNTPIRVSIPEGATYLRLEGDAVSYASCPVTSSALSSGSGLDIQVDMTPDNWFAPQIIAAQYQASINERSWAFYITNQGVLTLAVCPGAVGVNPFTVQCPVRFDANGAGGNIKVNPHQRMSVRVTLNTSTPLAWVATFYVGSYCGSWTSIGTATIGPSSTNIFSGTAPLQLGYAPDNDLPVATVAGDAESYQAVQGKIHAAVLNTYTGSTVANPDFTAQAAGVTSFADAESNTWTVQGTAEVSARKYRYHGYVAAWPQSWKPGAANTLVTIAAGGKLRQQGNSQAAVNSPMYRAYSRGVGTSGNVAAYWPMEDLSSATQLASGLSGGMAMSIQGSPTLSSNSGFVCSNALPVINGAVFVGKVPSGATWSANSIRWLMQVPSGGDTNNAVVATIATNSTALPIVEVVYTTTGGGTLALVQPGVSFSGNTIAGVNGQLLAVQVDLQPSTSPPGSINFSLSILPVGQTAPNVVVLNTLGSVGAVQQIVINPNGSNGGLTGTVFGHLGVYSQYNGITAIVGALAAWQNEPAGLRFQRFCAEESIGFRGMGNMGDTVLMGIQTLETVATLLQECVDTDRGMWIEPKQWLGYGYRNRVSIGNQTPWVTFDYNQDHLSNDLEPTHDDQVIKNDITVTNQGDGSSAEAVLNDGSALSVGVVGRYDTALTLNLANDNQLFDEANWILHALTVNEPRYTAINVDLANSLPSFVALYYQILDAELGDRVNVVNPPAWLPPGVIDQIIQGATEPISMKDMQESWNGVPTTPFNVCYLDDAVYGRGDTDGSALAAGISAPLGVNPWFVSAAGVSPVGSLTGWSAYQGSLSIDTSIISQLGNGAAFSCCFTSNGTAGGAIEGSNGGAFTVTATNIYQVSSWVYFPAGGTVNVGVDWLGSSGYLSTSIVGVSVPAGVWTPINSGNLTAPTGAISAYPRVGPNTVSPGMLLYAYGLMGWQGAVTVSTANASSPLWTTNSADFPLNIICAGEVMTVTNITGSSSPQTFTVVRSVNGVVKPQVAGSDVRLAIQPTLSL